MDIWSSILKILAALFLVFLNGFFVLAEFSLVKVRHTRLAELSDKGSRRAAVALEVTSHLDAYLSACQLGITLASLGLGWLGEPAIAALLEPLFASWRGWSPVYTHTVSYVIAFSLITFLHIVFGELIPKSLAIQDSEKMSLLTAQFLKWFNKLFYPIIWAFNAVANSIMGLWGVEPANEADIAHSPEELKIMVEASEKYGFLDSTEGTILENVLDFSDRIASDVMVPRQDMVCLYLQDTVSQAVGVAMSHGYVRYPLCDGNKDNVVGMIHMRDLLKLKGDEPSKKLYDLKRNILIVPETNPISHLLQKMRSQRAHIALIVDEFGGTAGLVTIEDLVEELSGEIYDEFEYEQPLLTKNNESEYEIHGRILLADLSNILDIEFEDKGVSTAGGFISAYLGHISKTGEKFEYKGYVFEVMEMDRYRVKKIKVSKQEK